MTTVDNSNLALMQIDAALQQLATTSAQLGAYQNRFQAAITGLNTDSTNLTSAKSAIVDTDYAQATSSLSKAQILQQAEHGDGGAGQHDPAEHSDAAAEAPVRDDAGSDTADWIVIGAMTGVQDARPAAFSELDRV